MDKKIEEKYQELSEIQHILNRPGMWVGSIKTPPIPNLPEVSLR